MNKTITRTPEKVVRLLYKALGKLIKNRIEDAAFTDEEDVKDRRYYFSTLEGLECLLIPLVNLPKNIFWEQLKSEYPELKNLIIDDINFVLNFNRGQENPPIEHGRPYFKEGGPGRIDKPYWTTECSSFTISVLTNFFKLRNKFGLLKSPSNQDVKDIIDMNFRWVQPCRKSRQGWSWISEEENAHPWPTWSLLDTFEEVLWNQPIKKMFSTLEMDCSETINYIIERFTNQRHVPYFSEWNKNVLQRKAYSVETALNLSRLMLAVSLHASERDIILLSKILYKWASTADFSHFDYSYHLKQKHSLIFDYSLVPSVFRSLIVMAGKLKPRRIDDLNDHLGQDHEYVINKVFSKLNEKNYISQGKYKNLWGSIIHNRLTYELYFTERTIESLTEFIVHYGRKMHEIEAQPRKKRKSGAKISKKRVRRSEIPNDIDKYTLWIPVLSEGRRPEALQKFTDWPVEDMLEFYVFRLFTNKFILDGKQWGYTQRAKDVPDGFLILSDSGNQCYYDAKATKGHYKIIKSEEDKFVRYAKEGKQKARATHKEVQFFLVIGNSFSGDLKTRAQKFQERANLKLVCMKTKDICDFADKVQEQDPNPSQLALIKWSRLLSKGNPLIDDSAYKKIFKVWQEDLKNSV